MLFGSSNAHKAVRKLLIDDHKLDAVIKLPSGTFKPYTGSRPPSCCSRRPRRAAPTGCGSTTCAPTA
nr:hypothetical protein [Microbacterium schleiferi]